MSAEKYKSIKLIILAILLGIIGVYAYNFGVRQVKIYSFSKVCPLPKQAGNADFYAEYLEDYILSIIFSGVKNGSYIDVGANDPTFISVTKHFYNKGWRGINIEPIPHAYELFLKERPEDINVSIGISNKKAEMKLYRIYSVEANNKQTDGLSTFSKEIFLKAKRDAFANNYKFGIFNIPVNTLNSVLQLHPLDKIDFMNIDVEGSEKQVLEGMDLKKYRPSVFIIEAVEPRIQTPSHDTWEPILLNNNYEFMLFDGVNRYYLAKEYREKFMNNFKKAYGCAQKANEIFRIIDKEFIKNDSLF